MVGRGGEDLALMTRGSETTVLAGAGHQILVVALDASKAAFQDAALKQLLKDFGDDGTQWVEFGFVGFRIAVHEGLVMTVDALPDRDLRGFLAR